MVYTQGRGEQRGGIEMQGYVLSVEHNIPSPPEPIFAVLADAAKHTLIDGSGMLQGARDLEPERLTLGCKFGMGMKLGVRYSTVNKVVEFDENRLIAWQTGPEGLAGRLMGGRIWRYELEPGAEGTLVRESWDITPDPIARPVEARRHLLEQNEAGHGADAGSVGPADGRAGSGHLRIDARPCSVATVGGRGGVPPCGPHLVDVRLGPRSSPLDRGHVRPGPASRLGRRLGSW